MVVVTARTLNDHYATLSTDSIATCIRHLIIDGLIVSTSDPPDYITEPEMF